MRLRIKHYASLGSVKIWECIVRECRYSEFSSDFSCIAGVALCVLCLMSAIGFSLLDNYGNKKLGLKEVKATSSVKA